MALIMAASFSCPQPRPPPVEQLEQPCVEVQPAQPEPPALPPDALPVTAKALKSFFTLPLPQSGQCASPAREERIRSSNRSRQLLQVYSKIGIGFHLLVSILRGIFQYFVMAAAGST
jgi:hypothetical protein